jgi:hypothetical protein
VRTKKNGLGAASRCLIFERWVVAQASLAEAPRSFLARGGAFNHSCDGLDEMSLVLVAGIDKFIHIFVQLVVFLFVHIHHVPAFVIGKAYVLPYGGLQVHV